MAEERYDFTKLDEGQRRKLVKELQKDPEDRDPDLLALYLPFQEFLEKEKAQKKATEKEEERIKSLEEEGSLPITAPLFQVLQGGTLGGADEIANLLVDPTESDIAQRIQEETDLLQRRYPKTAFGLELLGGGLSGVGLLRTAGKIGLRKFAPFLFGGGATSKIGRITRPAIPGSITGGTYSTLSQPEGEKDIYDTLLGGGIGAVGGPVGVKVADTAQKGIGLGLEQVSRLAGKEDRAIRDVLNPIIDDIGGEDVAREGLEGGTPLILQSGGQGQEAGKVAADITPFVIGSQKASDIIKTELGNPRDDMTKTFDKIVEKFEGEVKFDDINPNDFKTYTKFADTVSDRIFDVADTKYRNAQLQENVSSEIYENVSKLLNDFRIKNMGKKVVDGLENVSDRSTLQPVLRRTDDGGFEIVTDELTVAEVEAIRRQFAQFIKDVPDDTLKIIKSKEASLRTVLDDNYGRLADARRTYAGASEQLRAYQNAKKLYTANRYNEFTDSLDDALANAKESTQGEILNAYRRGALVQINKQYDEAADKVSFIKKLNDKGSNEYKLLKEIYPNKSIKELTDEIEALNRRFAAKSKFATGSPTAERLLRSQKDEGFVQRTLKYVPIVGSLSKDLLGEQKLSPAQQERLAQLVVEANPRVIDRIRDPKYSQYFKSQIQQFLPSVLGGIVAQDVPAAVSSLTSSN